MDIKLELKNVVSSLELPMVTEAIMDQKVIDLELETLELLGDHLSLLDYQKENPKEIYIFESRKKTFQKNLLDISKSYLDIERKEIVDPEYVRMYKTIGDTLIELTNFYEG